MVQDTIKRIEDMIRGNESISKEIREELLGLLEGLKPEMEHLSKSHEENAESVAGFMEQSTHEALRKERNPALKQKALDGLSASVKEFEASHPKLVEKVNYIINELANYGI